MVLENFTPLQKETHKKKLLLLLTTVCEDVIAGAEAAIL